tara:strand:- start:1283 stop:2158 length:876 start_codon:yes stop_codon:yes gene_type:complete
LGTRLDWFFLRPLSPAFGAAPMWIKGEWDEDRADYDRLLALPYTGWSWEYMRRNPFLKAARRRAGAVRAFKGLRPDGSVLFRLNQRCYVAERFGLHFLPNPALSAFDVTPFWLPEVMSASFDAALQIETRLKTGGPLLRWDEIPGEKHFLVAPGRREKLVIEAPGYAAQLALDSNALPVPQAVYFSLTLGAGQLVGKHLREVEEFARVCHGATGGHKRLRGLSPEKLRDAIIALDGELAGVPRRRIASAIFGENLVAEDWDGGVNSYKQRTKRLVDKGLSLMRYGYKKLLR